MVEIIGTILLIGGFISFFFMAICLSFAETIDDDHPDGRNY
jgi:hypothetical protein